MSNCKTCKHWNTNDQLEGVCERIHGPQEPESEDIHDVLAYVEDGSDYYAALITAADFGCVLHEANE